MRTSRWQVTAITEEVCIEAENWRVIISGAALGALASAQTFK